ncbi:MAG TPA: hypothetical protein VMO47_06110 [Rhodothermales bacterium]|nr:hypothetical protein [Rhodothermales bacterium]
MSFFQFKRTVKTKWQNDLGHYLKENFPRDEAIFTYDWPGAAGYFSGVNLLEGSGLTNDYAYNDDLIDLGVQDYLAREGVRYFLGPNVERESS